MGISAELIAIISSVICGLVWLVRLEGKVLGTTEKLKDLSAQVNNQEKKHEALDNRIMEKLSFIERSLAKIEGQLITRRDGGNE